MPNTQKTKRSGQHKGYPHPIENHEQKEDVPSVRVAWITQFGTITVSVLACIATVLGTILAFPPVLKYFQDTPTPTMLPLLTLTSIPPFLSNDPPNMTATPFFIPNAGSPVPLPPSTESPAQKMIAFLNANATYGKAPLQVNMNAQNSYVQLANGSILPCGQFHLCDYVWTVYRDGKSVGKPVVGDGVYDYTFTRKGEYFVTVYVCRGSVCEDDGITIEVK
jgi:hypothetical protein